MSVQDDIQAAQALAQRVAEEAGLTVRVGESPTGHQAKLAALHAREDAAACMALLAMLLERQASVGAAPYARRAGRALWWAGAVLAIPTFGLAALLLWSFAYVLGGSFWKPPRAD